MPSCCDNLIITCGDHREALLDPLVGLFDKFVDTPVPFQRLIVCTEMRPIDGSVLSLDHFLPVTWPAAESAVARAWSTDQGWARADDRHTKFLKRARSLWLLDNTVVENFELPGSIARRHQREAKREAKSAWVDYLRREFVQAFPLKFEGAPAFA